VSDPAPTSVNERLVSLEIIRQVLVLRFSLHLRDEIVSALNDTEQPISEMLRYSLRVEAGLRDPSQVRALDALVDNINALREPVWQRATEGVLTQLTELGDTEPEEQRSLLGYLAPALALSLPLIRAGAPALLRPFQGRTARTWLTDAAQDDKRRIRDSIHQSVARGLTPEQVAQRVLGTAGQRGADGVTQTSRNHVDTITRSAATSVVNGARDAFNRANPGVLTTEQFIAVLDSGTTVICRGLNGTRYPVGDGPIPPMHMGCRSMRVLVLPLDVGGPRWEPEVYAAWIRRQPQAVQVELMGRSRLARMRAGTLDPGRFTDYGSRPMTLSQVREAARRLMGSY